MFPCWSPATKESPTPLNASCVNLTKCLIEARALDIDCEMESRSLHKNTIKLCNHYCFKFPAVKLAFSPTNQAYPSSPGDNFRNHSLPHSFLKTFNSCMEIKDVYPDNFLKKILSAILHVLPLNCLCSIHTGVWKNVAKTIDTLP